MRKLVLALAISAIAGMTLFAQSSDAPRTGATPDIGGHARITQAMSTHYDGLQWQSIVPELGADSPQVSILRSDPKTQATQLLIRMPKQMHVPMHWHSANETHTIIRGTWVFEHDGKRDQLGPGDFNYMPAKMHHQAWSSDDALVFITVDSGWDINWVNGPPTTADLGKTPTGR
jgi:mannose-6-phosphate isomerase-like protein (cupin superfamily)